MSAFGKRGGPGGFGVNRPAFGVAKPMSGPSPAAPALPATPSETSGGAQFPPVEAAPLPGAAAPSAPPLMDAMARLAEREAAVHDSSSRVEGFEASVRVTNITEVIGMEGPVIITQELFKFEFLDESEDGKIIGEYRSQGLRPYTLDKARQFGFDQAYLEACL